MKSKIKTILLTLLIFSFAEFAIYIGYALWDMADGLGGNRNLTEQEFSDISNTLNNYFNTQENTPERWEITFSYFAKEILNDPVPNQYIVTVICTYKNENKNEKKKYRFEMLKGWKDYYIDWVEQCYMPSEQINKYWLQEDIENFEEVLNFIDKNKYSNSGILKLMNRELVKEKLGFNLLKSKSAIRGGYLSIYVSYISYKNSPCELRILFYADDFSEIEKELPPEQINKIKEKFILDGDCYVFSMKNDENYQKYYNYKQKQIGEDIKLDLPSQYQEYYDSLTSPFNEIPYGYIIGYAPEVPHGRIAMEKLLELKNRDIFINIIKSDNPTGRMYGMEGLLRLDNSSKNIDIVNEVFEKLIKDKISYEAQSGCIVTHEFYKKITPENINNYIEDFSFEMN